MQLNPEQQHAINAMRAFIDRPSSDQWCFTLQGFAGTGKTTVITKLASELSYKRVALTAPTHKAVHVMESMAARGAINPEDCKTIHSLLGLKIFTKNDRQTLKPGGGESARRYDLVIVDECSMINDELFGHIQESATTHGYKVIFMGDPAQLPPVNSDEQSPTFAAGGAMLTTVMRQAKDHPILGFCTDIRERWTRGEYVMPQANPQFCAETKRGLHVMLGPLFEQLMPSAFRDKYTDTRPDQFRVIAWTNRAVDYYNRIIQSWRYPDLGAQPFMAGEPVIISEATKKHALIGFEVARNGDPIINTETPGMVIGNPKLIEHPRYQGMHAWRVSVLTDAGTFTMWTLDARGKTLLKQALDYVANQIKDKIPMTGDKHPPDWHDFWRLKEAFAVLRPAYAMTAHKSQGGTFENVFVDAHDIFKNPNKKEAMQCLYVACSRATNNLIINDRGGNA